MPVKALLIILDGCRPDALQAANTPRLRALWSGGAYTWTARSVMPSITLPAHTSMFRGVPPEKHGIGADNVFQPGAAAFPSILDVAQTAGLHTAMFYSWEQLRDLAAPGSLKMSYCAAADPGEDNDAAVAAAAADYLVRAKPDLCVLYLGDIDLMGHFYGWMSAKYISTIEANDRAVGLLLNRLLSARLGDTYTILVQADHGGHDFEHGTEATEDMLVPWFLSGPSVKRGHAIQSPVSIMDTAPTLAHLLGLERPAVWEGQPVLEALE